MSALRRYFFDTVYYPRSAWRVVAWWERRRLSYNAAVGACGLLTLAVFAILGMLPPRAALVVVVPAYALAANVCYSLGALADLAARRVGGPDWAPIGPTLFRYGFVFSVGLTLLPIPVAMLGWLLRLLARTA
ncbi:hypothetical protein J421_6120 (plasmid) [Gemmatirosa kalamazoonensis]|uniref:Uncharacterized protein n=1 Tax=Gemmatirosa kalamazoonensis TaxID=861299 RepID=W0RTL8_9BACT|nr:hypothetical protein [Gemmatirosa kalamazoonensis]AHG93655.1 hypothetical protein J421_6120 [Gemmatirosa kalamazoonensis]